MTVGNDLDRRTAYYDAAAAVTPYLATATPHGVFLVHTADQHVGRTLFGKQGRGDMGVLGRAVRILEALNGRGAVRGTTFLDAGANIGTTTVPAIMSNGFGRAFSFEPEAENFRTLKLNLIANDIDDRVSAMNVALSSEVGSIELAVNPSRSGMHWVICDDSQRETAAKAGAVVTVTTVTLDSLICDGLFEATDVGLLWMDAQGHEGHILRGAERLVSRGVPVVLEWDPAGLDEVGDRAVIQDIAVEHYTHFVDLGGKGNAEGPRYLLRPSGELPAYSEQFLDERGRSGFTDVLFVRLSAEQMPAGGLVHALKKRQRPAKES